MRRGLKLGWHHDWIYFCGDGMFDRPRKKGKRLKKYLRKRAERMLFSKEVFNGI